ncbi:MAG: hypothetical protein IKT55_00315 [Clostridia bacterium]|nr:hypothetical protein [Clostridia bacterium]
MMKRKLFIVILVFFLCCFLLLGIGFVAKNCKNNTGTNQSLPEKTESIFVNELKDFDKDDLPSVKLMELPTNNWFVEGSFYTVCDTLFSVYDQTVNWNVDLSVLSPCGVYEDGVLFSSDGRCDNSVLIVKEQDRLLLLVRKDVLSPDKYSFEDFVIVESDEKMSEALFEEIWKDHLSGEHNISYLLIEDATAIKNVKFKLKSQPELIYSLSYCDYRGMYYTKLPFNEN